VIETEERPERKTGKKDQKVSTRYYYTKYPIVKNCERRLSNTANTHHRKTRCVIFDAIGRVAGTEFDIISLSSLFANQVYLPIKFIAN
jgi:hypothetical protein